MSTLSRRLLALLLGSAALSVFNSDHDSPADDVDNQAVEDSAARKERLLLMGRLGRGEISFDQAKAIYGEDLRGVATTSTPPIVAEQPEHNTSTSAQDPAE